LADKPSPRDATPSAVSSFIEKRIAMMEVFSEILKLATPNLTSKLNDSSYFLRVLADWISYSSGLPS